ncbi:MAG: ABC transporter substrate-binding protein [Gammaproteobacteria bacterium]
MITWRAVPVFLLLVTLCASLAAADPLLPDQLVKTSVEEVREILRGEGEVEALSDLVYDSVAEHFDFEAMTRLAVGKYWRGAETADQEALVCEFRTLLVRTYSVALQGFDEYQINYRPLDLDADAKQTTVQTLVSKDGGKPIRMDYRMIARDDGWKVYDVLVDGVSLVVNYRSLFGSTVEKSGMEGLIRLLREKNAERKTG